MTNHRRLLILPLLICLIASGSWAQLNLPTKKMNWRDYYYYKVKSKETIYGIAHKLKLSQEDILRHNPTAASGLKDKQMLFFPVDEYSQASTDVAKENAKAAPAPAEISHTVEAGETLFGIAKSYGLSIEEVLALNPQIKNGKLKAGTTLRLTQPGEEGLIFVTVQKGNTLFGIAKHYNTTVEQIMSDNPGISPSNCKAGEVIRIAPNSAKLVEREEMVTKYYPYQVQKGDSFESIAQANGITTTQLREANPDVEKPQKGTIIYLPRLVSETVMVSPNNTADSSQHKLQEIYRDIHFGKTDGTINVALLLPFMLSEDTPSKQARLFTEFYKGFLLAVNDLRNLTSKHINIAAFDTEGSIATTRQILTKEEMKQMDIIFAPDNCEQISLIAEFGKANNVNVVNTFSTKNEDYIDNPCVFHLNTPNAYINVKVTDWIGSHFKGYDVVLLRNPESDTKEIAEHICNKLKGSNCKFHEFPINPLLNSEELSATLTEGHKYLFITNSGAKRDLQRIVPVLCSIKENRTDIEIALFGYPEWSTYLNAYEGNLKKIDTYFYSRFFAVDTDFHTQQLRNNFKRWYGEELIYAAPQFGMLGYDTGYFFLKAYIDDNESFRIPSFSGVQTDFSLERTSNWSGMVNKAVYIVHLAPSGVISRELK